MEHRQWIAKARRIFGRLGCNMSLIAEKAGWSTGRLSGNLNEGRIPRADRAIGLCKALNVSPEYLFDDAVPISDSPPAYGQGLLQMSLPPEAVMRLVAMALGTAPLAPAAAPPEKASDQAPRPTKNHPDKPVPKIGVKRK